MLVYYSRCGVLTVPERVLGSAGAFWMKSGVAIGPIFSLTEEIKRG